MNIVEEFLHQPIPPELWHYTSIKGFDGMVSTGAIWATEARSSRDQTEFIHARKIAEDYLSRFGPVDEATALGIKLAKELVAAIFQTGVLSQHKTEVFIASFSSASDRKSQWIDYSEDGRGVAVVMDLGNVRPPTESEYAVTLAPCAYKAAEKERLVEYALRHVIDTVRDNYRRANSLALARQRRQDWQHIDRIFNVKLDKTAFLKSLKTDVTLKARNEFSHASTLLSIDLIRLASHCKHHGYCEEFEWRLALPHTKSKPFIYSQVVHEGRIIAHHISGKPKLPITRVVAGFACRQIEHIKEVLEKNAYDVPVEKSDLPELR